MDTKDKEILTVESLGKTILSSIADKLFSWLPVDIGHKEKVIDVEQEKDIALGGTKVVYIIKVTISKF